MKLTKLIIHNFSGYYVNAYVHVHMCMETHQGRWSVSAGAWRLIREGGASVLVHGDSSGEVERQCWCMETHQGRWSISAGAWRLIGGGGASVLVHGDSGEVERQC